MRYIDDYIIQQEEFLDDKGWFSEDWQLSTYLKQSAESFGFSGPRGVENLRTNYLSQGRMFQNDMYWHWQISSSNQKKEIRRSYFNLMQVFSAVGGLLQFITIGISTAYYFYNYYKLMRHAVLYSLIGKQSLYPQEYRIKGSYARLLCGLGCKCCTCCAPKDDNFFEERKLMLSDCITCIDEKMDIKNFLHDSMDFMAIKQLLMKSRHKMLMPSLILNITRNKTKLHSGYKTSFVRNMCERIDKPVFTLEEAVAQLHDTTEERPQTEKDMDQLFLHNLPQTIMDMGKDALEVPMNARHIVIRKEGFQKKTKIRTVQDFDRIKTKAEIKTNQRIAP
jgi:hypothetical protein